MDATLYFIKEFWPIIGGFVAVVAWLVRVDNRTDQNAKTIARVEANGVASLEKLETRFDERRREDMSQMREMFGEIKADLRALRDRG